MNLSYLVCCRNAVHSLPCSNTCHINVVSYLEISRSSQICQILHIYHILSSHDDIRACLCTKTRDAKGLTCYNLCTADSDSAFIFRISHADNLSTVILV